ncbi:MAG TPA: PHB depolymerase family esterase, partial [Polyangiaceae bacterium]
MRRVLAVLPFVTVVFVGCGDDAASSSPSDMGTDAGAAFDAGASVANDDAGSSTPVPSDAGASLDASISTADCGNRVGQRGLTHRTLTVGGVSRTTLVYLPPSLDAKTRAPFVFVFHGYTMSGQSMHDITRFADLADKEGFGVAFPDGEGGPNSLVYPWNVKSSGQSVCGAGDGVSATGDDMAFVDAIEADVAQDQCTDTAHVFATGFSMGAYFTEHLGCTRADLRAIGPHSGGTLADLSSC